MGMAVNRREALFSLAATAVFLRVDGQSAEAQSLPPSSRPFTDTTTLDLARDLATRPYRAPDDRLPRAFADLTYDDYRKLQFDRESALWRGESPGFQMQLFHRGFLYRQRVELHEVVAGQARPFGYDPAQFQLEGRPPPPADFGHAGFRITYPLNQPHVLDEVCAFLGASYFRAVGRDQRYGLSARGLALRTGDPAGEEFPMFRAFWIERPEAAQSAIIVHALLDSPSATAAFRFGIRPGETTVFDVRATVFPRVDLASAGIAPLTSMYYFAPNDRNGVDDYRGAVHDSDGLLIATARGEQIWRPLHNPRDLHISQFSETSPRGFGLMQRRRSLAGFNDLEASYERRPSLWVEPVGDWGAGSIRLLEIPTPGEIHDNIVAFWRPDQPMRAGEEYAFAYRLHWSAADPDGAGLARFIETRTGAAGPRARLFVLDVVGAGAEDAASGMSSGTLPTLHLTASAGEVRNQVVQALPRSAGWRVHFELVPGAARLVELRALLRQGERALSETWLYRWTA